MVRVVGVSCDDATTRKRFDPRCNFLQPKGKQHQETPIIAYIRRSNYQPIHSQVIIHLSVPVLLLPPKLGGRGRGRSSVDGEVAGKPCKFIAAITSSIIKI